MNITGQKRTSTLSLRQERMIVAILQSRTIEEAVKAARISRTIFYQWLNDDERFRSELQARRQAVFESHLHDLKAVMGGAVAELNRLLGSKDERIRLGAVRTSLDAGMRANEQLDFMDRLEALEQEG
jgi:hypothetical protein